MKNITKDKKWTLQTQSKVLDIYDVTALLYNAHELSRIAIHHGIWRELIFSIRKSSTEQNDEMEPTWHFPSALSPGANAEWELYKILDYMGLHEILPPGEGQIKPNPEKIQKKGKEVR